MDVVAQSFSQALTVIGGFFYFDPALLADPQMIFRLVLQALLLMGSAFFSGSETALFSLSNLDVQQLHRARHPRAGMVHNLLSQPRRLIISILCGNELINIAAVANMTGILVNLYGPERAGILSIVVMVPLLLLVGEITPKTIAVSNPVRVTTAVVATPLSIWVRFITPLRWALRAVADRITGWIVGGEKAPENILQIDEFRSIVDEVADEGQLRGAERALIYRLLDAGATEIVQIMTPRTLVDFIDGDLPLAEVVQRFQAIRHSRVPVYRGHRDHIIGFLHIEKILPLVMDGAELTQAHPDSLLSPLIAVPPTKKIDEMFDYFQEHNARAALVLNEFGGVEGMVTMRDVLTFIFGPLTGDVRRLLEKAPHGEGTLEVSGDMRLMDFNALTNLGVQDARMTTIGGVVFRQLDRIPQVGDAVPVDGALLKVLEMEQQRIKRLQVTLNAARRGPGEG